MQIDDYVLVRDNNGTFTDCLGQIISDGKTLEVRFTYRGVVQVGVFGRYDLKKVNKTDAKVIS